VRYDEAVNRVLGLADVERFRDPAHSRPRYDLSRITELLKRMGSPQDRTPTVHITGSKGKGSTAAMVASVLSECGYRVGLFTSPHLHIMRERIQIEGRPISPDKFADLVERLWPIAEGMTQDHWEFVTTFEMLTAMAFKVFADTKQDFQIVEVGLGGKLDATNVVTNPMVSVLTSISLDHTEILGDTIQEIARDKAGIIRSGSTVVTALQEPAAMEIIREVCQAQNACLIETGEHWQYRLGDWDLSGQGFTATGQSEKWVLWMPLLGLYQIENACSALAILKCLRQQGVSIPPAAVEKGFQTLSWPGRFEITQARPTVIVDGAHNPYSLRRLVESVNHYFPDRKRLLLFGASYGHDVKAMVEEICLINPEEVFVTRSRHPRAIDPETIVQLFMGNGFRVRLIESPATGIKEGLGVARENDLILATGSLFVAAEVRELLKQIPSEVYSDSGNMLLSITE